jgi:hypothetical protein
MTEYHVGLRTTPIQLWGIVLFWRIELFTKRVVPVIPWILTLLLFSQAAIVAPTIKHRRRYLDRIFSFAVPEGMALSVPSYICILLSGLLISFFYPIGGSVMVLHYSSFLYDIHRLTVADMNRHSTRAFMARIGV